MSTMHCKSEVREDDPKNKPENILFYNSTKGAVYALDNGPQLHDQKNQ